MFVSKLPINTTLRKFKIKYGFSCIKLNNYFLKYKLIIGRTAQNWNSLGKYILEFY